MFIDIPHVAVYNYFRKLKAAVESLFSQGLSAAVYTVLEDRTTIRILEEQKLAVSISECDLEHIDAVVERMDRELSDEGFGFYYDAVQEIAEHILSLDYQ